MTLKPGKRQGVGLINKISYYISLALLHRDNNKFEVFWWKRRNK